MTKIYLRFLHISIKILKFLSKWKHCCRSAIFDVEVSCDVRWMIYQWLPSVHVHVGTAQWVGYLAAAYLTLTPTEILHYHRYTNRGSNPQKGSGSKYWGRTLWWGSVGSRRSKASRQPILERRLDACHHFIHASLWNNAQQMEFEDQGMDL